MARLTSMLSVCCVALAAVMIVGGAAAAGQPTTWLADTLRPSGSSGVAAGVAAKAQHYAEVILEKVSLPILKGDGCGQPDETGNQIIFDQILGCPAKESGAYNKPPSSFSGNFASSDGVASCTFETTYASSYNIKELAPGVKLIGTASFTCDFNSGVDKCNSPLCDGLTITGFGRVAEFSNNAENTKLFYTAWFRPPGMESDVTCGAYLRAGRKTGAAGQNKKAHAEEQAAVETASYSYYDDEPTARYYPAGASETARVLMGTFTVVSPHSPTKFTSGRIQTVAPTWTDPIPPAPTPVTTRPTGAYVLTPWTVDLEFIGGGKESPY